MFFKSSFFFPSRHPNWSHDWSVCYYEMDYPRPKTLKTVPGFHFMPFSLTHSPSLILFNGFTTFNLRPIRNDSVRWIFFFFCFFLFEAIFLSHFGHQVAAVTLKLVRLWTRSHGSLGLLPNVSTELPPTPQNCTSNFFLFFVQLPIRHQAPVRNLASLCNFKFNESRLGSLCRVVFPRRASRRWH